MWDLNRFTSICRGIAMVADVSLTRGGQIIDMYEFSNAVETFFGSSCNHGYLLEEKAVDVDHAASVLWDLNRGFREWGTNDKFVH